MTRFHVSVVFVFVLLAPFALSTYGAAPAQVSPHQMPPNVSVVPVLMPVFEEIAAVSPTFNAQCARIASAKYVHVVVNAVMASSTTSRGTARTTMRRFASGALLANVEMPVPLTTLVYAELFGHEFEHIIEQIDRVDLDALALVRNGATRLPDGAYETARARKAGRVIADEAERPSAATIMPPPKPRSGVVASPVQPPAATVKPMQQH